MATTDKLLGAHHLAAEIDEEPVRWPRQTAHMPHHMHGRDGLGTAGRTVGYLPFLQGADYEHLVWSVVATHIVLSLRLYLLQPRVCSRALHSHLRPGRGRYDCPAAAHMSGSDSGSEFNSFCIRSPECRCENCDCV